MYYLFLFTFYVIIFRDLFLKWIPLLNFTDELFAVIAIPLFVINLKKCNWKYKLYKYNYILWLILFSLLGLLGNLVFRYQSLIGTALPDMFLNFKFWMSIYVSGALFANLDLNKYGNKIGKNIKFVVWIYILLIIIDYVSGGIFPANIRYGFRSTQLFYSVHTVFAATCGFLIALLTLVKNQTKNFLLYMVLLLLLLASTMRSKAFGAVLLYICLYYVIIKKRKKVKLGTFVFLGIGCLLIGFKQIYFYFFSNIRGNSARNMLLLKCFAIAKDHFPLGSGFGTFASHYSGIHYSPLYYLYDLFQVYGLTPANTAYVSDSFWPMVIGQNGYLGALLFMLTLYMLYLQIQQWGLLNREYYLASFFALAYLGVSSLAESAFVNSFAIPFGIVIGMVLHKPKGAKENG